MVVDHGFFANKQKETITQPASDLEQSDIAIWGSNNLLPQEMWKDIENTGVLGAGIETKVRIAIGSGPLPAKIVDIDSNGQEILEFVNDQRIKDFMEMSNFKTDSYALCKDLLALGNAFDQVMLSADRKEILGFKRADASDCRFSKQSPKTKRSEQVIMSSDWSQYNTTTLDAAKDNEHSAVLPLLDKQFPYYDLIQRKSGENFMLSYQYPLFGRKYYALPLWYAARVWVKMAQGIPDLKKAMINNQITLNYLVEIHPKFWETYSPAYSTANPEEKKKTQEEFYDKVEKYLVGGENSYKSLFTTSIIDVEGKIEPGIKITQVDGKGIPEGKMLVDSAAANSEILFAMMINPALIGADTPGGPYSGGAGSGSNIREEYLKQVMLMEVERIIIARRFDLVKRYNKWDPDLVLRFPNKVMTTLNTGANTAATA
jgi:hypothetical protein